MISNQCGACFFYRVDPRNLKQGTCRFNPPAPMVVMGQGGQPISMGTFPPVQEGEWCGKWLPKDAAANTGCGAIGLIGAGIRHS